MTPAQQRVIDLACRFMDADSANGVRSTPWKTKLFQAIRDYRRETRAADIEAVADAARRVA